jgi:serine/threonine protein kinase
MAVYLEGKTEQKERDMTCCVMTRIYRPPEIILTHNEYGKPADIWSLGVVLAEMMACSDVYYRVKEFFSPRSRFLFLGKACFPISPNSNKSVDLTKEDQLIKILERFPNTDEDLDISFLKNEEERAYHHQAQKLAQSSN